MTIPPNLSEPHQLADAERELLDKLLEGLKEHDALMKQAEACTVQWVETNGQPSLMLDVPLQAASIESSAAANSVVAEAIAYDQDGQPISVLAHVHGGRIYMVGLYREDGMAILNLPSARSLRRVE